MPNGQAGLAGVGAGALQGAAFGGIPGLAIGAGLSFLPGLLSMLFGGNEQERLRRQIAQLTSPESVGTTTEQFFQQFLRSPAFALGQREIAGGANVVAANLARTLGARGIGTTGVGSVLASAVPSVAGPQLAQLRAMGFQGAQQQAQQSIQARLNALLGTQGPTRTTQLFAGGLESFGPILQAFLASRYPNLFALQPRTG